MGPLVTVSGLFVIGFKSLRFLCHVLGLTQPRPFKFETLAPSYWDLCSQIQAQRKGEDDEYEEAYVPAILTGDA